MAYIKSNVKQLVRSFNRETIPSSINTYKNKTTALKQQRDEP